MAVSKGNVLDSAVSDEILEPLVQGRLAAMVKNIEQAHAQGAVVLQPPVSLRCLDSAEQIFYMKQVRGLVQ